MIHKLLKFRKISILVPFIFEVLAKVREQQ